MLSVLIAARNEIYLEKTIRDVLANAEGEIEVLVALDGYIPDPQIVLDDNRVTFYHEPVSIGQRQSINKLAKLAKGEFIMKLDAHCAMDKGWDVKLVADATDPSVTWVPRMYNLDIETFKPKLHKLTDYMYISSPKAEKPFRAEYYTGDEYKRWHRRKELLDDTMACMGPCWFMHKSRFFEQGGCDEGHGSWGAMSVEVSLKAWMSGGSLKVNKKTWFAHWFRGGIGFPYELSGNAVERARKYSRELFVEGKFKGVRDLQWVVDKFNPPTWGDKAVGIEDIQRNIRHSFGVLVRNDFSPIGSHKGDRETLINIWKDAGYKEGAEIGVKRASYSQKILSTIPDVKLHCIDPWGVYKESHLTKEGQDKTYEVAMKVLAPFKDRVVVHKDYSQNVASQFKDKSLDFLFIDGMHTFDGCALDLILWVPKVKVGGMVAVHDYLAMRRGGVVEAVDAYTRCHLIHPWYVTREILPTAFWVVNE